MPVTEFNLGLAGAGLCAVATASAMYRRKATMPFKLAYFASWVTLGPGVLLLLSPDEEEAKKRFDAVRASQEGAGRTPEELKAVREAQMQVLRRGEQPWHGRS